MVKCIQVVELATSGFLDALAFLVGFQGPGMFAMLVIKEMGDSTAPVNNCNWKVGKKSDLNVHQALTVDGRHEGLSETPRSA